MSWKKVVFDCIRDLCIKKKRNEFSLSEIYQYEGEMSAHYPENKHIKSKIRQTLQYLRDDGLLIFIDDNGNYRLK